MFWKSGKGKCHRFREMISPYIDNKLHPAGKQALESHLASCQECRQEMESLRAIVEMLHRVPEMPVPRSFTIINPKPVPIPVPAAFSRLRWATAVAFLVLVTFFTGDLFQIYPEKTKTPTADKVQEMALDKTTPKAGVLIEEQSGASGETPSLGALQTPSPSMPAATPLPLSTTTPSLEGLPPEMPAMPPVGETPTGDESYSWPVRWIELALLVVMVVMLSITILVWRRRTLAPIREKRR